MNLKVISKRVKPWCVPVGLTLTFFIIFRFILFIGFVPTESMEPTLPKKSFIFGTRFIGEPQVEDIIVFRKDGNLLVKRIAAVPGDIVDLNQLAYGEDAPIPQRPESQVTVPAGCYFLLGDNAENSYDSRYWEDMFIPKSSMIARIFTK